MASAVAGKTGEGEGRGEGEERGGGADKFYCVSFRPLHLSALFRAERASCPRFLISRRPVSRKKRGR